MISKYETFVMMLTDQLHRRTDIALEDISFYQDENDSLKDRLQLVCAERKELRQVCSLHTMELYESFRHGTTLESILSPTIESIRNMRNNDVLDKIASLKEYDSIREDLFVRLINLEKYHHELEHAVYREIGDIALVLYLRISDHNGCLTSMKIRQSMLLDWNLTPDEAIDRALLNTYLLYPPRIFYFEKLLTDPNYTGENFMNLCADFHLKEEYMGNCLSCEKKTNGAISIFLPGVARRIGQLLENDFYIVFTSVHEVMIHDEDSVDPDDLRRILRDTIQEGTPEEDFLSFRIYHYCRENGKFSVR